MHPRQHALSGDWYLGPQWHTSFGAGCDVRVKKGMACHKYQEPIDHEEGPYSYNIVELISEVCGQPDACSKRGISGCSHFSAVLVVSHWKQ